VFGRVSCCYTAKPSVRTLSFVVVSGDYSLRTAGHRQKAASYPDSGRTRTLVRPYIELINAYVVAVKFWTERSKRMSDSSHINSIRRCSLLVIIWGSCFLGADAICILATARAAWLLTAWQAGIGSHRSVTGLSSLGSGTPRALYWAPVQDFAGPERSGELTHSTPAVPNCCCSKSPAPYWSNTPFLILSFGRSGARVPECQKLKWWVRPLWQSVKP